MRLWFDDLALVVDFQRDGRSVRVTIDDGDVSIAALGEAGEARPREPFAGLADAAMIATASADPELLDAARLSDGRIAALLCRKDRLILAFGERLLEAGERWPSEAPIVVKGAKNATWPKEQVWETAPTHGRARKMAAERGAIRLRARGEAVAIACARTGLCARVDRPGEAPHLLRAPIVDDLELDALPTAEGLLVTLIAPNGASTLIHWDLGGRVLGARGAFGALPPAIVGDVALFFDHGRAPAQDQLLRLRLPDLRALGGALVVDARASGLAVRGDGRRFALALGARVLVGDVIDGALDVDAIHAIDGRAAVERVDEAVAGKSDAVDEAVAAASSDASETSASDALDEAVPPTNDTVDALDEAAPATNSDESETSASDALDEAEPPTSTAADEALPEVAIDAPTPTPEGDAPVSRAHLASSEVVRMATPAATVEELRAGEDLEDGLSPEDALEQLGLDEIDAPDASSSTGVDAATCGAGAHEVADEVADAAPLDGLTETVAPAEASPAGEVVDRLASDVVAPAEEVVDRLAPDEVAPAEEVVDRIAVADDEVALTELVEDAVANDEVSPAEEIVERVAADEVPPPQGIVEAVAADEVTPPQGIVEAVADAGEVVEAVGGEVQDGPHSPSNDVQSDIEPALVLTHETGDPRLALPMGQPPAPGWSATVGAPFEIAVVLRSAGGASAGVRVSVGGEALARGLVEVQTVDDAGVAVPLAAGGAGMRIADAGSLAIPAGLVVPVEPPPVRDADRQAVADALAASHVRVLLRGRGVRPGSGLLTVSIAPLGPGAAAAAPLRLIRPVIVTR